MSFSHRFLSLAVCLLSGIRLLPAQQPAGRILVIPPARGVYYESPAGWVNLPASTFLAFQSFGLRDLFWYGSSKARAKVDGPGAALTIADPKPTLYMRGYRSGTDLYLVKLVSKRDYREVKMATSYRIDDGPRFPKEALQSLHLEPITDELVALTPLAALEPGEYILVSSLEPQYRSIQLGYEFGVSGTR
jgi:hypothetical protein